MALIHSLRANAAALLLVTPRSFPMMHMEEVASAIIGVLGNFGTLFLKWEWGGEPVEDKSCQRAIVSQ